MKIPRRFLLLLLMMLRGIASCDGATSFLAEGYVIRVWQTEDGLPQNFVTSAAQTRDGYLWLGTNAGLARFNGESFRVFSPTNTPAFSDRRISQVFEEAGGALWIGHESGAISCYQDGKFTTFAEPPGTEDESIIGLGSDTQGQMWALRMNGAVDSLDDARRFPSLIAPEHPGIMGWSRSDTGSIWITENGRIARIAGGTLQPVEFDPSFYDTTGGQLAAAADGGVWIIRDNRIRKWRDGHWSEDRGEFPWRYGAIACALELRDGTLAVGTVQSGLYLVFPDCRPSVRFDRANGLPQNWVRFLYEDREGNLWTGIGNGGVVSIHPSAFSMLISPDQWRGCTVTAVAPSRDNGLWIATDGAGLYRFHAGEWTRYAEAEGLSNPYVHAVTETRAGDTWAGSYWWGGPYRLENHRFALSPSVDEKTSPVLSLLAPPDGDRLLVGTREGLLELEGTRSTWLVKSPGGFADDVTAIVQDRDGAIWCGFSRSGIARLAHGETTFFRRKDGLASDAVQCVFADDDGSVWIGTADNGLSRFKDGRFTNLGADQGLADEVVCHILDDDRGYLWLSTHHGLQRIAKHELNRCADLPAATFTSQIYNREDGLPSAEFTGAHQGAGCRSPDGRLWFACRKGVVCVDPSRVATNPTPPPVLAEALLVDGREIAIANGVVRATIYPNHQRLEFRYAALSFVAPEKVRFRHRLEGIDSTWIDAGPNRAAFYSRLPAGTYRFRVVACNNDGVWNTDGASLAFTVAPFFWQTWWFLTACLAASVTLIAWLARYVTRRRMQRRIEQMERQHEIERERARIAQDIHDDVGASLSRIAMLSQPARADLLDPERTGNMLSHIYTVASEVTRSLDEIVWAVDPHHDTLDSLVDYMARFAQSHLAAAQIRCRLDLPTEVPGWPLTAETRHNLFLAFKESLNNAAKHAAATEVHLHFRLFPDSFAIEVADNGHGFAIAAPTPDADRLSSGHGLPNLRERMQRIGGRCEIISTETGTRVILITSIRSITDAKPGAPTKPPIFP